jgi:hypothetical protein
MGAFVRPGAENAVVKAAKRRGVYPVTVLENLALEKFNPFGHTDVDDRADYVTTLRKQFENSPMMRSWLRLKHGKNLGPRRDRHLHRLFQSKPVPRAIRFHPLHRLLFHRHEK